MLRLTLHDGGQPPLLLVVDEVSGVHRLQRVPPYMPVDEQDAVWERLEVEVAGLVAEDLQKCEHHYAGLRGTTVLGYQRLDDGRLQLRSTTDVMVFDTELALVARKALSRYIAGEQELDEPAVELHRVK